MEEQEKLEIGIGDKESEAQKLTPKNVKVESIKIQEVGQKKNEKVVLTCKHPDREDTIEISSIEYMIGKTAKTVGLWYNLDEDKKLQKGSATAYLINYFDCVNLKELIGKELPTIEGDSGYLAIKGY